MTWVKTIELGDFLEAVRIAPGTVSTSSHPPLGSSLETVGPPSTLEEITPLEKDPLEAIQKQSLDKLFFRMDQEFDSLLKEVHAQIPGIVMKLLRKVLGAYEMDTKAIHSLIQDLLKEVSEDSGYVEVFISSPDWEVLNGEDHAWASHYSRVSFFKDDKLKSGDCMLKSRFGLIDGRLEKKLSKIEKEFAVQ